MCSGSLKLYPSESRVHLIIEVPFLTLKATSKRMRNSMLLNSLRNSREQVGDDMAPGEESAWILHGEGDNRAVCSPLPYRHTEGLFLQRESRKPDLENQEKNTGSI